MNDEINRIVYLDMDGCICAFNDGFYKLTGKYSDKTSDSEFWGAIESYGKAKFFSELGWTVGGKDLWNFIFNNFLNVKILSALGKSDKIDKQTTLGKLTWLRHHIPLLSTDDIILVDNKHKKCHYSKPGDIIIDDTPVVIEEWIGKGGIGILYKNSMDTINKLKDYV